jgi:hypothetical protein
MIFSEHFLSVENFFFSGNGSLETLQDPRCRLKAFYSSTTWKYTNQIYDPEEPRTFKSVCVKSHTTRSLHSLICEILLLVLCTVVVRTLYF